MTLTYTAESLSDFMARIREIEAKWKSKDDDETGFWYRGLQKSYWPLTPKLYRPHSKIGDLLTAEDEIREEFVRRAPSLTEYEPANVWEWYFLMQHYSAPTRLLDWTENPQIGLYFAVKDSEGFHDAAVWVLDPWWLNENVLDVAEVLPPGSAGLAKADAKRYQPWLPDRFDAKRKLKTEYPVAVFPNQFDARIAAQRSCFTIHGRRRESLENLFPRSRNHLAKIVIPSYATEEIADELDKYGIDEVTVYPDLEGLGKAVSRNWLPRKVGLPHDELYTRLRPSKIHGVGVFAIRKIKKGTNLFSGDSDEMFWVKRGDLPKQKQLRNVYDDFAVWKKGRCGCPRHFHRLTMAWYLNDPKPGKRPNVKCDENYEFLALRDIKPNEELTVNSNAYSEPAHSKAAMTRRVNNR